MLHGILLFISLFAASTDAPTAEQLRVEVRQLVRRLDASTLADRDAAEADLLKRGPEILDLLPAASDRMSAETRERLDRVRQKLQRRAAEDAARASLITLAPDEPMPLKKILAELSRQSGNAIADPRGKLGEGKDDGPALKVHFEKTPFWQALDQLADQAGLNVHPFSEKAEIVLTAQPNQAPFLSRTGRACYTGPFRLEPTSVVARRILRRPDGVLTVNVEAAWEPRLKMIGLSQRMADVSAVDERGNALAVADADAQLEIPTGGAAAVEINLPFRLPSRDARRIALLRGKLLAMIPGKIETFRFDKLTEAKNVERRAAGVVVTLEQVRKNNNMWEVRMQVRFDDAGDALASHRTWIFNNEAYLEGPGGEPVPYDTFETIRQGKNELGIAYLFVSEYPLNKLAFVYKTPGAIVQSGFDYEFKDIELP